MHRLATWGMIVCGLGLIWVLNQQHFDASESRSPVEGPSGWRRILGLWDSGAYLELAAKGYQAGSPACAFYPLWPALIRAFSFVTYGNMFLSGFVLANGLSILGLHLFGQLVRSRWGEETAQGSVALILLFPGAIFLSLIYTEPLFFLLAMGFFRGLCHKDYALVAFTAFLLPLTRAVGIFCLAPLVWHLLEQRGSARLWLVATVPLAGYATYFGVMYASTGNPFEGFTAQNYYVNQPSIANLFDVSAFLMAAGRVGSLHGMVDSAIDRLFFLVFLAGLPGVWKLDRTYFWYALGTGLVPAMSNWFLSYSRFLLLCFPLFIVYARYLEGPEKRCIRWSCYWLLAGGQVFFLWRFLNLQWVG
jgi:hypothetical protein